MWVCRSSTAATELDTSPGGGVSTELRFLVLLISLSAAAQQSPDPGFTPQIPNPPFAPGAGPLVLLDEAHHNFHTVEGRFSGFVKLARAAGYRVEPSRAPFAAESPGPARILVIANALHPRNHNHWQLPTPSAFKSGEIQALVDWINGGGSLLLIADHMPFAGAASVLGHALGVRFANGYVRQEPRAGSPDVFTRGEALRNHTITRGIGSVATFTGSAFQAPGAEPLLVLGPRYIALLPDQAGQFTDETPRISVAGWYQGAVLRKGKGRVAVFGEAAMFSAQLTGAGAAMGMNHPKAKENAQFVLNVLRWLSGAD